MVKSLSLLLLGVLLVGCSTKPMKFLELDMGNIITFEGGDLKIDPVPIRIVIPNLFAETETHNYVSPVEAETNAWYKE